MSGLVDTVQAWPIWGIGGPAWAALAALLVVVLQHGGTAGIHAAMGRDGMIDHRRAEAVGALRGTVALAALMGPVFAAWTVDALSSPERMDAYVRANEVLIAIYGPVTVVALLSFVLARTMPWQVRSNLNSAVLGTLELLRPWIAAAGVAAAAAATRDPGVAALGAAAVVTGLLVGPLTRRWWYARPVRLADLGVAPEAGRP